MGNGRQSFLAQSHVQLSIVTFVLVAAAAVVAALVPQDHYESTAVISVEPGDPDVSTQLVNFLIPTVEARVEGQALASEVASRLPADLARAGWEPSTSVEPGSGVMRITVASDNRDVPMAAANAYAATLAEQIPGTDVLDAVVIDPASRTVVVSSRSVILISGLSLAFILAALVGVALRPFSRRRSRAHPASFEGREVLVEGRGPAEAPVYSEDARSRF